MEKLNLGTRVEMFAICASIEYDLKHFIAETSQKIIFTVDMQQKAHSRKKDIVDDEDLLNQLDLADFVSLIVSSPFDYGINNDKANKLDKYFKHIIPVRNRVMHTKPLELGDRSTLLEVLETIEDTIPWINWEELRGTKKILKEDSSKLLTKKYIGVKEYNPKAYHNLPLPEFDDTGFIGRKRDVKIITELLLNKKNQIISVVGNGGMGKTAIVIKVLYDLLEYDNNPFEAIIWMTLKTKTLAKGEFIEIHESIKDITQIFSEGKEIMQLQDYDNSMNAVIDFMGTFKTLLVLDNLETINAGELNSFFRQIPENSKVLITSRLGIGEFEIRQKIDGMFKNDAIAYYRELSKYYGLKLHEQSDEEIYDVVSKKLYNNPLSIKWFISGIYSGTSSTQMLSHKDELIEFCISNIFEKLSVTSARILQLFLLVDTKLTYGLISYYIDDNELVIRNSINELLTTYMIQASSGEYIMNDMSREYISLTYPPNNEFVKQVMQKRKELTTLLQSVRVYVEQAPYNPNTISFNYDDIDQQLATYHLHKALRYGKGKDWVKCDESIQIAASIAPDYYEVYKTKAFLEAEKGELYSSINNYKIALSKCNTNREKAVVYYLYSVFYTVKMQDTDNALKYIQMAEENDPNSNEIQLEKVRVYTFLGKYDEAEELWYHAKSIDKHPGLRTQNIMANRFLDIKNRQSSILERRDYAEKYRLLQEGIGILDDIESIDDKTAVTLLKLLLSLSYLYFYKDAIVLLSDTLQKYSYAIERIENTKNKDKILDNLNEHREEIEDILYEKIYIRLTNFKNEAESIVNENEGIVAKVRDTFGFISNSRHSYNKGLFFLKKNAYDDIKIGDKVSFERYNNQKGEAARNIRKK